MFLPSSHVISDVTKPPMQSFWPISVATSGTIAATPAGAAFQHVPATAGVEVVDVPRRAELFSGSVGLYVSHCDSAFEYCTPPSRMTWLEPAPRIALTIDCMPAAWYVVAAAPDGTDRLATQPSRQHASRRRCPGCDPGTAR